MTDPILISLKQRFARGRLRSLAKHSYCASANVTKSTISANSLTLTEEILNGKLHFFLQCQMFLSQLSSMLLELKHFTTSTNSYWCLKLHFG